MLNYFLFSSTLRLTALNKYTLPVQYEYLHLKCIRYGRKYSQMSSYNLVSIADQYENRKRLVRSLLKGNQV